MIIYPKAYFRKVEEITIEYLKKLVETIKNLDFSNYSITTIKNAI